MLEVSAACNLWVNAMRRLFPLATVLGLVASQAVAEVAQAQPAFDDQKQILVAYSARFRECVALHDAKKLKSYKAVAECWDAGFVDRMSAANYRYVDLLNILVAQHGVIAEQLDTKKITWAQAQLENAQATSQMVAEVQRRDMENAKASADTVAAQAAAKSAQVAQQAAQEQAEANAESQAQNQVQAPAALRAQLLGVLLPRLMTPPQPYVLPMPQIPVPQTQSSFNCTSTAVGNTAYTNCH